MKFRRKEERRLLFSADLAFDADWKNTTRLSENTRVIVRWISPVRLEIISGDLYSKLDQLPKNSTFEVVTPTAIAVVRGTKFRTTYLNGKTTIYNDSETSVVYVYHVDANGNRAGRALELKPGSSTTVAREKHDHCVALLGRSGQLLQVDLLFVRDGFAMDLSAAAPN